MTQRDDIIQHDDAHADRHDAPHADRHDNSPLICFAGGGTGGHIYPLISLANAFQRRFNDIRCIFLTTNRDIDARILGSVDLPSATRIIPQPVQPIPSSPLRAITFFKHWRTSTAQVEKLFTESRPMFVIGSGGFGSGPPISVAHRMGIHTSLLNPDAVPGKANRYLGKKADLIFAQWDCTREAFRRPERVIVTGCPIRDGMTRVDRNRAMAHFDLDQNCKILLVTGASQGARSINEAIVAAMVKLKRVPDWQILHLTGDADLQMVQSAYAASAIPAKTLAYTDQMAEALSVSDLVLSRAGASTLAELTAMGIPSVLMPYPYHRDRHQHANAGELEKCGAAVVVEDRITPDENAPRLESILALLMSDDTQRSEMARRAMALGRPTAADDIVDRLLSREASDATAGSVNARNGEKVARETIINAGAKCPKDASGAVIIGAK